jgi:hypothetical protein
VFPRTTGIACRRLAADPAAHSRQPQRLR